MSNQANETYWESMYELADECRSYNQFHKRSQLSNEEASSIWMDKRLKVIHSKTYLTNQNKPASI